MKVTAFTWMSVNLLVFPSFLLTTQTLNLCKQMDILLLRFLGKFKFTCTRDKIILHFEGYVARNIQAPILCGGSFLSRNKITQDLYNNKIVIDGKYPHSAQTQSQLLKCLTLRTSSSLSTPSQKMSLNKTLTKYLLKTMFLNI